MAFSMDNDKDLLDESDELPETGLLAAAEETVSEDGRAWYVIHCYSGYENKVRHSIEQRIETMGMQDHIFDVVGLQQPRRPP